MKKLENIEKIILDTLLVHHPVYIGLFGSFSRGDQNEHSDIDLLVKFEKTISLLSLIRIENELTEKLGYKVDLITEGAMTNNKIRQSIQSELQYIYRA